ncbi:2-keto-4-pentenoate hydratase/2-oxohepta-3-ene-1,7-dioic acid hydratase in catechol pathway [Methylorubrum rhodinum]|uniref:2-keto-4-pentenoate hydratase/2-oxohepta-3-ene-1,7-dioic acid hydratase in catechol pathway n=1 Tax=Methylorubrum rhodinum TaxID=29428 RepID=A0A840ZIW7_9HYPH|nr:2-keto-4-pentenoate hydratase/2-oxohepta-3-ene-1,7-dioic acid hydratase in catechol pathway [Methylorubrum rhodinum]
MSAAMDHGVTRWIGFRHDGAAGFGRLDGETVAVFEGDLFDAPTATGRTLPLADVTIDLPCRPSKMIALWNNFGALAEKLELARPEAPLFLIKPANTYRPSGATVTVPEAAGRALYEGELGIVIGKTARDVSEAQAPDHVFGFTCINDVTSAPILKADASFTQWARAKGLDGFGPFGPVIATGLAPESLTVRTLVNGRERQNFPISDMLMPVPRLVALISQGMTLEPGDVIACGTSVGSGPIPKGAIVEVVIEGIGTLANRFA